MTDGAEGGVKDLTKKYPAFSLRPAGQGRIEARESGAHQRPRSTSPRRSSTSALSAITGISKADQARCSSRFLALKEWALVMTRMTRRHRCGAPRSPRPRRPLPHSPARDRARGPAHRLRGRRHRPGLAPGRRGSHPGTPGARHAVDERWQLHRAARHSGAAVPPAARTPGCRGRRVPRAGGCTAADGGAQPAGGAVHPRGLRRGWPRRRLLDCVGLRSGHVGAGHLGLPRCPRGHHRGVLPLAAARSHHTGAVDPGRRGAGRAVQRSDQLPHHHHRGAKTSTASSSSCSVRSPPPHCPASSRPRPPTWWLSCSRRRVPARSTPCSRETRWRPTSSPAPWPSQPRCRSASSRP